MKRRILSLIVSLFLLGTVSAQHYTVNPHAYDNNMPIVAVIHIDNAVPATGTYEIGAFIGDEVRGSALIQSDLDNTYWMQVYYNTETESSETVSFKVWNGTEELIVTTTVDVDPEGVGTKGTPQELEIVTAVTQTTPMAAGWTWWSSSVELGNDGLTMLENALGNNADQIKSRTHGQANRNVYVYQNVPYVYWDGPLTEYGYIHNEEMYMISINTACDVAISGARTSSSNHPITISNGWNWIGYPSQQVVDLTTALGNYTPQVGEQIKGRDGYANYATIVYGGVTYGYWDGSLTSLEPGKGYMYYSLNNQPQTLVYSAGSKTDLPNTISNNTVFQPEDESYLFNMTITAVVELEGKEIGSNDYEVAAFVGDQCRGTVKLKYVEPLNRYLAFLLVFGDQEEDLSFVLTDGNKTYVSDNTLKYSVNGIVGSLDEPATLRFDTFGVNEDVDNNVQVYPNPSHDLFNVVGNGVQKVEVLDIFGQIIYSKEVEKDYVQIDLTNNAVGTYVLRVITKDGILTNKLIKN